MQKTAKRFFFILISVLLLSCSPSDNGQDGGVTKEIRRVRNLVIGSVMEIADISYFDKGLDRFKFTVTHYGLVRFDKDGGIIPALAESWETADLKRWVFHLRKNALWHDGEPVTSKDIAYTFEFGKKHVMYWESAYGDIISVEAPDPLTVVIEIENPDYNFLTTIALLRPVPAHIFRQVEDPKRYNDEKALVGTGPFAFDSFDREAGIARFTAFDGYWDGKPEIDALEVRLFRNQETMMMALQKGQIDVPYTYAKGASYYYVPSLMKNRNIDYMVVKGHGHGNVLWINNSCKPLNDRRFRQALSYALNYEEIGKLFTAGYGALPDAGFAPESTWGYIPTRKMVFDLEKSKRMMDAAGFSDRDGDGFRESPDGAAMDLTLVASSELPDQVRLGEMLEKYLADAGVKVTVKLANASTFSTIIDVDRSFDIFVHGTTPWGMNMGAGYGSGYVATLYYGWSMVSAPDYEALIDELKTTRDKEGRRALAKRIQRYYADEMTQIPLYNLEIIQPHTRKYEGWVYSTYCGVLCPETFYNLHPAREP